MYLKFVLPVSSRWCLLCLRGVGPASSPDVLNSSHCWQKLKLYNYIKINHDTDEHADTVHNLNRFIVSCKILRTTSMNALSGVTNSGLFNSCKRLITLPPTIVRFITQTSQDPYMSTIYDLQKFYRYNLMWVVEREWCRWSSTHRVFIGVSLVHADAGLGGGVVVRLAGRLRRPQRWLLG